MTYWYAGDQAMFSILVHTLFVGLKFTMNHHFRAQINCLGHTPALYTGEKILVVGKFTLHHGQHCLTVNFLSSKQIGV